MKKCLIISEKIIPKEDDLPLTTDRSWNLAIGLRKVSESIEPTIAYTSSSKTEKLNRNKAIKITNWNKASISKLIEGYDTIIVSYSLTEASLPVIRSLKPNQQLILDCHKTPLKGLRSVETTNLQRSYGSFRDKANVWNSVLRRGDLYICNSQKDKDFYKGMLASISRINPVTYGEENIFIIPEDSLSEGFKVQKKTYLNKLAEAIISQQRSLEYESFGTVELINDSQSSGKPRSSFKQRLKSRLTARIGSQKLSKQKKLQNQQPKIRFFSHQLDLSGAPFIAIDLAREFKQKYPEMPIEFHTFLPKSSQNIKVLNKVGIKPKIHTNKELAFEFNKGDVVVLNTPAFSQTFMGSVYEALDKKIIKKLVWYIHDDSPERYFKDKKENLKKYISTGQVIIFTPAKKIQENYNLFFETKEIKLNPYKLIRPKTNHQVLKADDFNELRFILTGSVHDMRKGQLPILYAFINFKKRYFDKNPRAYRGFKLIYVGLDKDFSSQQILKHANKSLIDHFEPHGKVSHEKSLEIMRKSNITICYSLMEALPLFVFEGMLAGHPILRNDSSGMEEQLENGKNGFYLDTDDFEQVVGTIEKIMNRKKTTNATLSRMSERSYQIAKDQERNSYDTIINTLSEE